MDKVETKKSMSKGVPVKEKKSLSQKLGEGHFSDNWDFSWKRPLFSSTNRNSSNLRKINKGQLMSDGNFGVFKSPKKKNQILKDFL